MNFENYWNLIDINLSSLIIPFPLRHEQLLCYIWILNRKRKRISNRIMIKLESCVILTSFLAIENALFLISESVLRRLPSLRVLLRLLRVIWGWKFIVLKILKIGTLLLLGWVFSWLFIEVLLVMFHLWVFWEQKTMWGGRVLAFVISNMLLLMWLLVRRWMLI